MIKPLSIEAIRNSVAEHYSEKFAHPIYCAYDEDESRFDISGSGIPARPELQDIHPNGWSMLDHVSWIDAVNIAIVTQSTI